MSAKKKMPNSNEVVYSKDIFEIEGYPDLIQLLRSEDADAFQYIYKTYSEDLLIMAFVNLGSSGLAAKAVSQLFNQLKNGERWAVLPSGIYPFLCEQLAMRCQAILKSDDPDTA